MYPVPVGRCRCNTSQTLSGQEVPEHCRCTRQDSTNMPTTCACTGLPSILGRPLGSIQNSIVTLLDGSATCAC
jgi:hypothetical protein